MTGLLHTELVMDRYSSMIHADSHGSSGPRLGLGLIYYGISHAIQSQVSVCIGSGAGFVPGLLRQAQADIGIEPSVTYLIDANLPDLGFGGPSLPGGWMTSNSDFREWGRDVVLLRMLSRDAAPLFSRHGLSIDYLHIDGDHSMAGVLADLRAYAPLTSTGAVISLHDYRLDSVRSAVSAFLAENPGWEQLSFGEIGTGCCFLRQRLPQGFARPPARSELPQGMLPPAVFGQDAAAEAIPAEMSAQYERWPYLTSPGFQLRYQIAARFVDAANTTVVEVGGFPNSIVPFLDRCPRVYALEPYVPQQHEASIRRSAEEKGIEVGIFRGTAGSCGLNFEALGRFNVVALGFDLSEGIDSEKRAFQDLSAMAALIGKAQTAVLELPLYEASRIAWECIDKALRPNKVHEFVLDLREDPSAIAYLVTDGRAVRRVIVIEGASPRGEDEMQEIFAAGAAQLVKLKPAHLLREDPTYGLGDVIRFGREGNCARYLRRGWSYLENNLVWCQGVSSRMELRLANPDAVDASAQYAIKVSVWPAGSRASHPVQRLGVSVNGDKVYDERLDIARHSLEIGVQGAVLLRSPTVRIDFDHPDAIQPCTLDPQKHTDQRMLAFAFESLQIAGPTVEASGTALIAASDLS